jgi:hypothetical protein
MKTFLFWLGASLLLTAQQPQWTQIGSAIVGSAVDDRLGTAIALSANGATIAVSAPYNDGGPSNGGQIQVFDWIGGSWVQRGNAVFGESSNDRQGEQRELAISDNGNTFIVGAGGNSGNVSFAGHARVFDWNGNSWVQRGNDIDGVGANNYAGRSAISADGNTIAVGAPGNNSNGSNSGHVRIFEWNGNSWTLKGAQIVGTSGNESGGCVDLALNGDMVAIGSTDGEVVRIYEWNGSAWVQKGPSLYAEASGDYFGEELDLTPNGNSIIIGGQNNDGAGTFAGHVRVFDWNGSAWVQRGTDLDGDNPGDRLGGCVGISDDGNTIVAGAIFNDDLGNNSGKAKVYTWNGVNWVFQQDLQYTGTNGYFGVSVNMADNGNVIAVGGFGHASDRGVAVVYGLPSCDSNNSISITTCDSYIVPSGDETYTTPGTYTVMDTLPNAQGCDSILTINLNLSVANTGDTTVVACDSFTWYGTTYTNSATPTRNFTNVAGCDSVVTLHLTINNSNTGDTTVVACDSFSWYGNTYTNSATPTRTFTNAAGCDSVVTLHLTINNSNTGDTTVVACDNFTWYGTTYNNSAAPTRMFTNAAGCDSVVTLHLTINNSNTGDTTAIACDSFTWYGTTYNNSGTPTHTLTNAAGCDSVVTLHLTINSSNTGDTTAIACDSFTWYGNTYNNSGTPTHTLTNAAGCDSVVTLHLTINSSNTGDTTAIACDSFTWYGNTYTNSGTPTHTLTNALGCDSVVTLHLTINSSNTGDTTAVACNSFIWYGNTYSNSGVYTQTLINGMGCDSVVTLNLTVNTVDTSLTQSGSTLTANLAGVGYQWLNCDNNYAPLVDETSQSFTASTNGNYAVELIDNGCVDTSACVSITNVGFAEESFGESLVMYPNPGNGSFTISLKKAEQTAELVVRDVAGKEMERKEYTGEQELYLSLDVPKGVYFVQVNAQGQQAILKLLVK